MNGVQEWAWGNVLASGTRFTPAERRLIAGLPTPEAVQAWLSSLPYNWERRGETARGLRGVLRHGTAHCFEAAVTAAAILEAHGYPPILLDLESEDRLDHVLFLFRRDGKYGTVARSRCPGLHGRRPVFGTLRELVDSYAAPFVDQTGRLTGYGTLDLTSLDPYPWRTGALALRRVEDELRSMPHKAFRMPDKEFAHWKGRFDAWHERHGRPRHAWPVHYPGRSAWMGAPATSTAMAR